jgi:hypothetical protein
MVRGRDGLSVGGDDWRDGPDGGRNRRGFSTVTEVKRRRRDPRTVQRNEFRNDAPRCGLEELNGARFDDYLSKLDRRSANSFERSQHLRQIHIFILLETEKSESFAISQNSGNISA